MKPDLENDFKIQQSLLLALIEERRNLADSSHAANEIDLQIAKVENYLRSYQMVKWYEQQLQTSPARNADRELWLKSDNHTA